jgi:type 1 glutamine amidotransferase
MTSERKALIVWGGWDGHEPDQVAGICAKILKGHGFSVEISGTLESFADSTRLETLDLIVPVWTMGKLEQEYAKAVSDAVGGGVGLAGCHGGMCDAFRENVLWQFITGGNWVAHPGGDGVEYSVTINRNAGSLLQGIDDFQVASEQYYLHVDPAVEVLATTRFPTIKWYHSTNGDVEMPVVWTKRWGHGRVFYSSLGHHADILDIPQARLIMERGMLWAAEGRRIARENGLDREEFASSLQMF